MYPTLYTNSFVVISSFSVLVALALFTFVLGLNYFTKKKNRDLQFFSDHLVVILVSMLVFGRLEAVVSQWLTFSGNPLEIFYAFWVGGIGVMGMLIGLVLAVFYYANKCKEGFLVWLSVLFYSLMPALFLVYMGEFLDGMNYGVPTDSFLGIAFENDGIPYATPIFPLQLYFAVLCIVSFFVGRSFGRRFITEGTSGLAGFLTFAVGYFFLSYLAASGSMHLFGLRTDQIFAIMFALVVTILFLFSKQK